MDGDPHVIFRDESVETVERLVVGLWIGSNGANAELFRELEYSLIARMVFVETVDALRGDL